MTNSLSHETDFNPRSPHRERPPPDAPPPPEPPISIHAPLTGSDSDAFCMKRFHCRFQSTLPSQGATLPTILYRRHTYLFQSTLPSQGATLILLSRGTMRIFQSTLPSQGATYASVVSSNSNGISIHAPLTGSDRAGGFDYSQIFHFNPRSPHRERHMLTVIKRVGSDKFQSTLPSQGATSI